MYSSEEYMKMAEKPKVVLYGMSGIEHTMELAEVSRPTAQEVRNVCRNHTNGVVTFKDVFTFTLPHVDDIFKAYLYYDEQLVAMRMFPPIYMYIGDRITITFTLSIYLDDGEVTI